MAARWTRASRPMPGGERPERGAEQRARAEGGVERRQDRSPVGVLDRDPVRVHGDVEGAGRSAEQHEREPQARKAPGERRQRDRDGEERRRGPHDRPAAVPGDQHARDRHRDQRSEAEPEERDAELGRAQADAVLHGRDARRPAAPADPEGDERHGDGHPCGARRRLAVAHCLGRDHDLHVRRRSTSPGGERASGSERKRDLQPALERVERLACRGASPRRAA